MPQREIWNASLGSAEARNFLGASDLQRVRAQDILKTRHLQRVRAQDMLNVVRSKRNRSALVVASQADSVESRLSGRRLNCSIFRFEHFSFLHLEHACCSICYFCVISPHTSTTHKHHAFVFCITFPSLSCRSSDKRQDAVTYFCRQVYPFGPFFLLFLF